LAEQNETFKLVLSSPSSGVVSAEAGEAVVTITNDDGTPKPLSVGFAPATYRVPEGAAGTTTRVPLTIQLTEAQATAVVVNYATSNGTASAGSDYTAKSGTVTIPAGQTQGTFNVVVTGDSTGESDETFTVRLTSSTGGVLLNPAAATVTIVNDDGAAPLPAVRVSKASVTEGNTGSPKMTFTITLAKAMKTATVLTYTTLDGTAKAGSHYVAATGTVTIPAGRTSATVTVTVRPNRIVDGNRTLSLQVRSGSTLVATGVGTIIDDDKAAVRAAFAAFAAEPVSTGVTKKKI
jgi:chitinase